MNPRAFDQEFYPTPSSVVWDMLRYSGIDDGHGSRRLTVLDPSAGSGAILDAVRRGDAHRTNLYAIEVNPDHIAMLQGKGYPVVGHDFLQWHSSLAVDLILMNPPFSAAHLHVLHAWDVLHDGVIVCLCNESSLVNGIGKWADVRELIEKHGQWKSIGKAFMRSARPTDVEVAMIRLEKRAERKPFGFAAPATEGQQQGLGEDFAEKSTIAKRDVLGNMEHYVNLTHAALRDFMEAARRMEWAAAALLGRKPMEEDGPAKHGDAHSWIKAAFDGRSAYGTTWNEKHNSIAADATKAAWLRVVEETGFERYFTTKAKAEFDAFVQKQQHLPFTVDNVLAMLEQVVGNRTAIMEDALSTVFDKLTSYDSKNKASEDLHKKHWKTNRGHMLGMKIIVPRVVSESGSTYRSYGSNIDTISDLDKVLAWLTGRTLAPDWGTLDVKEGEPAPLFSVARAIRDAKSVFAGPIESEFFKIKCHKKGTVHLTFRAPKVWQDFNIAAAKAKRWLGAESSGK